MLLETHALCTLNKDTGNFLKRSHTNVLFKTSRLPIVNIYIYKRQKGDIEWGYTIYKMPEFPPTV